MSRRVIVLEDDESLRLVITKALSRAGFEVRATASPDTAIDRLARHEADALVADVLLGNENFLDRLADVTRLRPDAPIIVMSAQTTAKTAISANKDGAYEYLPKPFDINELTALLDKALEVEAPRDTRRTDQGDPTLIGRSAAMQNAFSAIGRLAKSRAPVLITGPDGSGRALAGRTLHQQSGLTGALTEAGPQRFCEASASLWEQARGGGLLLRRADAWSSAGQDFIREQLEAEEDDQPRLIVTALPSVFEALPSALTDLIAIGRITLPPLHQRGDDRAMLFEAFLQTESPAVTLSEEARSFINAQAWPGEILQLKRVARHIAVQGAKGPVGRAAIAAALQGSADNDPRKQIEDAAIRFFAARHGASEDVAGPAQAALERGLIRAALAAAGGVRLEAARLLGMNRNTFARKLDQLDPGDED